MHDGSNEDGRAAVAARPRPLTRARLDSDAPAHVKFPLGVNYWPSSSAMSWWSRFEPAEVEADFARIRGANLDCVRIFLLWESFQPKESAVDERALRNLVAVADIAARHELSLIVTLFTGHMSGVNWIPAWALADRGVRDARFRVFAGGRIVNAGLRNWYADAGVAASQALLARSVAQVLSEHAAVWTYDLGNENSLCTLPPTRDAALRWLTLQAEAIRSADRRHPITLGLCMEDLEHDRNLGPHEAATVCDFLSMHPYPIYARWARGETDRLVIPFTIQLTQWLGNADVLLEEFGAPTRPPAADPGLDRLPVRLFPEAEVARFVTDGITSAAAAGAMGGLVWCYSDYERTLWDKPPFDEAVHERYFGAWRSDHSEKPLVAALRGSLPMPQESRVASMPWTDDDRERFYAAPAENMRAMYRAYVARDKP